MAAPDTLRSAKIPLTHGSGAIPALGFGTLIPDPLATEQATPQWKWGFVTSIARSAIAMNKRSAPRELAGAAVFLTSDAASYVNGHVLVVDGGPTATF